MSMATFSLARTGSSYMTILVALERLLVVAYPLHFKTWMTRSRGLFIVTLWIVIIVTINSPWWLNTSLEKNPYVHKFPETDLTKFPYIFTDTWFAKNIYTKIIPWDTFADIFLPLPILLVINGLLYYQIYRANKNRTNLTRSQHREVNAARMFSKVATILFVCNACGIVHLVVTQSLGVFHHELMYLIYISMTGNSCINFFIYYSTSKYFKEKFKQLLGSNLIAISTSGSSIKPSANN